MSTKIYGVCLERLNHQINIAKSRNGNGSSHKQEKIILESYNTGEPDDIIDILELFDLENRTLEALKEKLDDLAYTISVLAHEKLSFGFTEEGHLGLYLTIKDRNFVYADEANTDILTAQKK